MNEFIYYLRCPNTNQVKYVGKSKNPKNRFKQHISKLDKQMTPKRIWLESLFNENKLPILEIIETCQNNGREREQYYVDLNKATILNIHNPEKGKKSNKWRM